ncbi:B-type flagellin [Nereida ignava]|uniref:Flagellin n=1 Tax=Nereida ignava TaxID=282199 RepID=A0A0U1NN06_9RHOB|nr:flagellin [Nereida ignava]CRK76110.1 B-type flagellin [Nereida ignava]SFJ56319.1 flagellin [Nereida ignava DSM 16309]
MTVINTNTASINAQYNLSKVNKEMESAMEQLSSGKRINSAADDAAGLSIATRMESNIRGLNMAVKNAADAQSLIDTAEGAMGEQTNILQRMRELAVQSSNATNSVADRLALQDEVTQLRTELDRIASTTSWAGDNLLNGDFLSKTFQIGAMASESVSLSIANQSSGYLGVYRFDSTAQTQGVTDATSDKIVTDFDILGKDGAAEAAFAAGSTAKTIAAAVNADSSGTGVTAEAVTKARISLDAVPTSTVTFNLNGGGTAAAVSATVVSNTDLTSVLDAINALSGTTQITATFDGTDKSKLILSDADGDDILIENFSDTGTATNLTVEAGNFDGTSWETGVDVISAATGANDAVVSGVVRMESSQAFTISDQEAAAADNTAVTGYFGSGNAGGTATLSAVSSLSIATTAGAQSAISVIDGALGRVNEVRSELGAISNRLDYTMSNLGNIVVNTEASQSRIEDADFAKATGDLTKAQIMSQAATAMLAQANSSKQGVLSLLQG